MNRNGSLRYLFFALLYFAQGSILGYFTALNALYLRSFDIPMGKVGIFAAIALIPLILKVFWGFLSDRVNLFGWGHRKPYIVIGLLMQAAGQAVFPFITPSESFYLLAGVAFFSLLGMALYDTCTDGLALDTTPPEEMGKIQGIMVAGRAVGVVVIAAAVGLISHHANWTLVFWSLALMTLIPLPLVFFIREPAHPTTSSFTWKAFRVFGKKQVLAVAMLGVLCTMIIGGTNQLVNPFLEEDFGISYMMAGFYAAVWGIGVVVGGLSGGKLTDRFGHRKALLGAIFLALGSILLIAAISGTWMAWPLLFFFGIAYGYYETVFFATSMAVTDLRIAASMFAILMAFSNAGSGMGMIIGGNLSDQIGFRGTFIFLAALNILILPLVPLIFSSKKTAGDQS